MASIRDVFNSTTLEPEYYQPRDKQAEDLFDIIERTRHAIPHIVLVSGEPGIGKSVFLKRTSEELLERNCFVVYCRVAHVTFQEFFQDLLREVVKVWSSQSQFQSDFQDVVKVDQVEIDIAKIPLERGREDPLKMMFKEFSKHVVQLVEKASIRTEGNGVLVFLIDQAENLIDIPSIGLERKPLEFFSFLLDRLYQSHSAAKRILFVFAITKGKYSDFDLQMFGAGKLSSVRRRPIEITPFSDSEIKELLQKTSEKGQFSFSHEVITEITKICHGYPNVAQMLGENLQLALFKKITNVPGSKFEVDMDLFKEVAEYTIYELVNSRVEDLSQIQQKILVEASEIVEENSIVTPRQLSKEKTLGITHPVEIIEQIKAVQSKNLIVHIRGTGADSEFVVPEWVRAVILEPIKTEVESKVRMVRVMMRLIETSPTYAIKTGVLTKEIIPLVSDTVGYERGAAHDAVDRMTEICHALLEKKELECCGIYFLAAVKVAEIFENKEITPILESLAVVGEELLKNSRSIFSFSFMIPLSAAGLFERLGKNEKASDILCRLAKACEDIGDEASLKGHTGYALMFYCTCLEIFKKTRNQENIEQLAKKVNSHLHAGLPGFFPEAYLKNIASIHGNGVLGAAVYGVSAVFDAVIPRTIRVVDEKKVSLPIDLQVKTLAALDPDMTFLETVFKELQQMKSLLVTEYSNQLTDTFLLTKNALTCVDELIKMPGTWESRK